MDRSVKIVRISEDPKGREIVISDIHGNLDRYIALLDKVNYVPGVDRLILLGDLVEKGERNLDLLHYIMDQRKNEDVWCLMGNCDFIAKNVLFSYRLSFLQHVLGFRKNSLIHEMADRIGLSLDTTPVDEYCRILRENYLEELSFLNDLPHIIEEKNRIYAHSAITSEENFGDDFKEVMAQPMFLKRKNHFRRTVVVGHMPVTEYATKIASFDPIYDADQNVYSIDGGNVVKAAGQLNALIFDHGKVSTESVDDLKEAEVIRDVAPSVQIPFFINWNNGEVKILKKGTCQDYVYSPFLKRSFWIDHAFMSCDHAKIKGTDYTNYEMPLKKGNHVKIVFAYQDKVQIKKDGVLGWTYASNLEQE